jgi:hypothetical protein
MSYRLGWRLYWTCLALPAALVALATLLAGGLSVRDSDITVKALASSQSVTYRREAGSAMLVALDELRHLDADRLTFLATPLESGAPKAVSKKQSSANMLP